MLERGYDDQDMQLFFESDVALDEGLMRRIKRAWNHDSTAMSHKKSASAYSKMADTTYALGRQYNHVKQKNLGRIDKVNTGTAGFLGAKKKH